ncbi:MAG: hypothetical protein FJY20_03430 [Bacteroidetes bacterium]|nr:hypothetical protein [Bacteroidota bacterium]
MKPRSMTPMGSLHPILFFAGVYVVALVFSIFICFSLFYSCNAHGSGPAVRHNQVTETPGSVASR